MRPESAPRSNPDYAIPIDDAVATFFRPSPARPTSSEIDDLLKTSFSLLSGYGHHEAAKRVGEKRLRINPASAVTAYLLKAIDGDPSLPRSPDDYLIEYFDAFADGFDQQLVNQLGYDIPQKLCTLISNHISVHQRVDVLDIGCGTGLCGPLLKPLSRSLTGVDLSPKMLQRAALRKVYDRLVQQEVTSFLSDSPASADLIIATDVLIYFGDLDPLFHAIARALRPGGLFAFSIENTGCNHALLPSGRFAHATQYVREIAAPLFAELASEPTTVRLEAAVPVCGNLFIFRRL